MIKNDDTKPTLSNPQIQYKTNKNILTLYWSKINKANRYYIYQFKDNKYKLIDHTTDLTYDLKLDYDKQYVFSIGAFYYEKRADGSYKPVALEMSDYVNNKITIDPIPDPNTTVKTYKGYSVGDDVTYNGGHSKIIEIKPYKSTPFMLANGGYLELKNITGIYTPPVFIVTNKTTPIKGKTVAIHRKDITVYTNYVAKLPVKYLNKTTPFTRYVHNAVDLGYIAGYPANQTIFCPLAGMKVLYAYYNGTIGNCVYLIFEKFAWNKDKTKYYDLITRTIHMQNIRTKADKILRLDEPIGDMGNTGSSSRGTHDHEDSFLNLHGTTFDIATFYKWRDICSVDAAEYRYAFPDQIFRDDDTRNYFPLRYNG